MRIVLTHFYKLQLILIIVLASSGFARAFDVTVTPHKAKISLSWDTPGTITATQYVIYRSNYSWTGYFPIDTVSSSIHAYDDTSVTTNTNYWYFVQARDGVPDYEETPIRQGVSELLATTSITCVPGKASVQVTWSSVNNADYYKTYFSTNGYYFQQFGGDTSSLTATHTGCNNQQHYYYRVIAYNDAGQGTVPASDGQADVTLAAPTNVTAYRDVSNNIVVTWDAVGDADSYMVYWGDYSGGYSYQVAGTTSNTWLNCGDPGRVKYLYVIAVNDGGVGLHSDEASAAPSPMLAMGIGHASGPLNTKTKYVPMSHLINSGLRGQ